MTVRTHTRVIGIVHSHVSQLPDNGIIDLSKDLIEIETSKAVKGLGSASLMVVPRRNYLNLIFPNDVINIYIDPGDGQRGFIRTFFGYVDRVERDTQTNEETGATQTVFRIVCTDFMKAFDKTDVYFNPHLNNRKEFLDPRFGLSKLGGGHALRTRGITAHGTPADMIESLVTLLLGFGTQWSLPNSYPKAGLTANREIRRQRAMSRVPTKLLSQISSLLTDVSALQLPDNLIDAILKEHSILPDGLGFSGSESPVELYSAKKELLAELLQASTQLAAYQTVLRESGTLADPSILDVIDLAFIEAMSIDGFIASAAVWYEEGTLASIMYGYSNEIVNELFFDLRPVASDGIKIFDKYDSCFGTEYSREPDDLGINVNGSSANPAFRASVPAVKYVPAIVFREYPYSTVEGLDLSNINLSVGTKLTFYPFGPIFSTDPNPERACRKLYNYLAVPEVVKLGGALVPAACEFTNLSAPLKHLDVVPITTKDIIQSTVGRSDTDIYNLFAIYATDGLERNYKYILQEFLPIVTPISIRRNGLRIQEVTTKYANYGRDNLCQDSGSGVDTAQIRKNIVRWALLLDHWNQHNNEYLSGTLRLRGMPELRVGYRLDWVDQHESYYVEQVSHSWKYGGPLITTVQVSRGQRNDPYPAYIPPIVSSNFGRKVDTRLSTSLLIPVTKVEESDFANQGGGNRLEDGRLAQYFNVRSTSATQRAVNGDSKQTDENILDVPPNADFGRRAEYPNYIAYREGTKVGKEYIGISIDVGSEEFVESKKSGE